MMESGHMLAGLDEDAFIKAVLAKPDDDAPRLIYADWLDDCDDKRGELIRIDIALLRLPETYPQRQELIDRYLDLLDLVGGSSFEFPLRTHFERPIPVEAPAVAPTPAPGAQPSVRSRIREWAIGSAAAVMALIASGAAIKKAAEEFASPEAQKPMASAAPADRKARSSNFGVQNRQLLGGTSTYSGADASMLFANTKEPESPHAKDVLAALKEVKELGPSSRAAELAGRNLRSENVSRYGKVILLDVRHSLKEEIKAEEEKIPRAVIKWIGKRVESIGNVVKESAIVKTFTASKPQKIAGNSGMLYRSTSPYAQEKILEPVVTPEILSNQKGTVGGSVDRPFVSPLNSKSVSQDSPEENRFGPSSGGNQYATVKSASNAVMTLGAGSSNSVTVTQDCSPYFGATHQWYYPSIEESPTGEAESWARLAKPAPKPDLPRLRSALATVEKVLEKMGAASPSVPAGYSQQDYNALFPKNQANDDGSANQDPPFELPEARYP